MIMVSLSLHFDQQTMRDLPISNVTVSICIEASDIDEVVIVLMDILCVTITNINLHIT